MKRVWMTAATACTLVVMGCGVPAYNQRILETVKRLEYEQAINTYLLPRAEGKFKELNVVLRLPKPAAETGTAYAPPPGFFDHVASFLAQPPPPPVKEGVPAAPLLPPLKIHVFVRQKPKKAAAKKGEPAAPEVSAANRGNFVSDVRQTIVSEFGPDAANEKSPTNRKIGDTNYKELIFTSAQTGNDVRAYFADANRGELEAALIFDIPKAARNHSIVTKGIDYCLRSFALGNGAKKSADSGSGAGKADGPAF